MSIFTCWEKVKYFVYDLVARCLPETVRRHVLYDLADRTAKEDFWGITMEDLYNTLKD